MSACQRNRLFLRTYVRRRGGRSFKLAADGEVGVRCRTYAQRVANDEWIRGKSLDELLAMLVGTGEVGSPVHEQVKSAIGVEIAKLQRQAANDALTWARVSATATAVSTVIAVVALLVALF
jgi:hypothetical protein